MSVQFNQVNVISRDMDASRAFYAVLGVAVSDAFMSLLMGPSALEPHGRKFVEALVDAILAAAGGEQPC